MTGPRPLGARGALPTRELGQACGVVNHTTSLASGLRKADPNLRQELLGLLNRQSRDVRLGIVGPMHLKVREPTLPVRPGD
jgi:hypothetical protein